MFSPLRKIAHDHNLSCYTLFFLGLILRVAGITVNGIHDLDQIIFEWGASVREFGLAKAFGNIYGLFSYALYGLAATAAEYVPRYWWAPYKLMEILFEVCALLAIQILTPDRKKRLALLMYWLNPWFILHGGWHGFWDGPHTFFALAAILTWGYVWPEHVSWTLTGMLLGASAMFKPQGLIYFIAPVGIHLSLLMVRHRHLGLLWFSAGLALVFTLSTLMIVIAGGSLLSIPLNYLSAVLVMPNLCNGCINIWRSITFLLQVLTNQIGPTYTLHLPWPVLGLFHLTSLFITISLIRLLSARLSVRSAVNRPLLLGHASYSRFPLQTRLSIMALLAFASLLISQIGTKAHINHSYTAMVLLIPFAAANRRIMLSWVGMLLIQFYGHFSQYHIGRSIILPERYLDYSPAQRLIAGINALAVLPSEDRILQLQSRINELLTTLAPIEPIISLLSLCQFFFVLIILREILIAATSFSEAARLSLAADSPHQSDAFI
jgi:hypothetical protein